jgi:hypothetical protein
MPRFPLYQSLRFGIYFIALSQWDAPIVRIWCPFRARFRIAIDFTEFDKSSRQT